MKFLLILLLFLITGCASSRPVDDMQALRLYGLNAKKYESIDIERFDNETTPCGEDKVLDCLGVSESTCHKIYRAAAVDCFDKFFTENGADADICAPAHKPFIDGCMFNNVLKYGRGGMSRAIQCLEST